MPDQEAGSGRWSLDHLFVDQDAIPTLVEVKRSSDTRIRREVVGQLLEYAANAIAYWPVEKIRAEFEARCEQEGVPSDQALQEFLGPEADEEEYWSRIRTNLSLGRVRLLFVGDKIPSELQRIVEYLNHQMKETEVLAVEIRQFEGEGRQTLVPRVLGQTAETTPPGPGKKWTEKDYLAHLQPPDREIAQRILEWAKRNGFRLDGGRGRKYAGLSLVLDVEGDELRPLYVYENPPAVHLQFDQMGPRFRQIEKRRELAARVNEATSGDISPEKSYPALQYTYLRSSEAVPGLLEALDWMVAELRSQLPEELSDE